jgi:hypothetical protein
VEYFGLFPMLHLHRRENKNNYFLLTSSSTSSSELVGGNANKYAKQTTVGRSSGLISCCELLSKPHTVHVCCELCVCARER